MADTTQPGEPTPREHELLDTEGGFHISAPFIKRPVATFLLSAAIIMAGCVAYALLPVSSLPQVEFPTISVSANFPGADPETMASAVATPLERQFSRIAGVNQMTSSSGMGSTNINLQFDLDRDVNGAARDVQAAINAARSQLPANLPSNPSYRKVNTAEYPIVMLGMTSDTLSIPQLYDFADSILAQKIAQVPGVGQVNVGGSAKPAVRIEANPTLLAGYGLGLESLRAAIAQVNVNQPTGYLNGPDHRTAISTTDQLFGAAAYAPLVIATDRGPVSAAGASTGLPSSLASGVATPSTAGNTAKTSAIAGHGVVRIQDVAQVYDGVENTMTGGRINGKPGILLMVMKAPNANVISTADSVLALVPRLRASIPPSIRLFVLLDRTLTIRASVRDVTRTLVLSILLVIVVVFFFLREFRSTLIPIVSIPLSLLGTFGIMYLLDFTIDNLSLMALTISTGFVVDDAIVVIENISRHLEKGMSPYDAAMKGSREIGFTVLSMSTSLIAVFIPLLLMGGIIGRLFREFAVTLCSAILVSLIVSLTTTPMLSARFLKAHTLENQNWFYRRGERVLAWLTAEYEHGLKAVLRRQPLVLAVTIATFLLTIYLYTIVPKGFFPQQDTGRIGGSVRGQQDVSFLAMQEKSNELVQIVMAEPGVKNVMMFLGGGGGGSSLNSSWMFMALDDDAARKKTGESAEKIIADLRRKTANIPGAQLYLQAAQDLNIGARGSATQYQYTMQSQNLADLTEWVPKLTAAIARNPSLKDVVSDQLESGLREQLVIDRDTASRLGVSPLTIDATLSDAFGQRQVSTTYQTLNQYHVIMEVAPQFQQDPDSLKNIYVKSTTGAMIPLTQVTHFEQRRIALVVNHQGQTPSATLSFNLTPGASLSDAVAAIDAARIRIGMPSIIRGGFQGTAQAFQQSLSSQPILILLAIFTVYIVLSMLYESFIHPLTILSTLPSAGVGALLFLLLFKVELSIIAMIGIILLIGIVQKNAIMMVDFALVAERKHGKSPQDAILEACLLRFRPILMTTVAALLGGLPLALGTGVGSELRRPLGITIVGGLCVSQVLTLFTTPVVYLYADRFRHFIVRLFASPGQQRLPGSFELPEPAHPSGD